MPFAAARPVTYCNKCSGVLQGSGIPYDSALHGPSRSDGPPGNAADVRRSQGVTRLEAASPRKGPVLPWGGETSCLAASDANG